MTMIYCRTDLMGVNENTCGVCEYGEVRYDGSIASINCKYDFFKQKIFLKR